MSKFLRATSRKNSELTARDGMGQVVCAVLLRADVAERAGTKGNHKEDPLVDDRTEGGEG